MIKNIGQISRDTLPLNSSRTTQIRMLRMLTISIYVANIIFSVAGMAIQSTHALHICIFVIKNIWFSYVIFLKQHGIWWETVYFV